MTWKGFIDASPDVTLSINGTDYTPQLTDGRIEATLIDSENPQGKLWQGQLTLANGDLNPANLDPTTNSDLNRGNQITIVARGNTWYWRVAGVTIRAYDAALAVSSIEVEVRCKLGFVNQDFPVNPEPGPTITKNRANSKTASVTTLRFTTWTDTIKSELTAPKDPDGVAYITDSDIDFTGAQTTLNGTYFGADPRPDGYTASQNRTKNPYTNASAIASVRGQVLYCDPADEIIKLQPYPLLPSAATLAGQFALEQMILAESSAQPLDEPVEVVQTTAYSIGVAKPPDEGGQEDDMQSYPITIPVASGYPPSGNTEDAIVVCERIEEEPQDNGSSWSQDYRVRARSFWIFPRKPGDTTEPNLSTAWVTVAQGTISRTYNSLGLPLTNNDVSAIARGIEMDGDTPKVLENLPFTSQYYGDATLVSGQGTRERFTYDARGVPMERVKDTRGTMLSLTQSDDVGEVITDVTTVRVVRSETETNTYTTGGRYRETITYSIAAAGLPPFDIDDTSLVPDPNQKPVSRVVDGVAKPSSLKPAKEPIALEVYDTEERISGNLGKGRRRSVSQSWAVDTQNATAYSRFILALTQTGALTLDCERGVRENESLAPCLREDVGDRALIRDAEYLEFGQGRMVFGYTGRESGRLAAAVTVPKRVISTSAGLAAGPMGDLA